MQDQFAFMSNSSSLRAWAFIQLGYDKKNGPWTVSHSNCFDRG